VAGTDPVLERLETTFNQDLNGDGVTGLNPSQVVGTGPVQVLSVGNQYVIGTNSSGSWTGPTLEYGNAPVTAGTLGAWAPIGAAALAGGGYDVAFENATTGQFKVWDTNANGNYVASLTGGPVAGTDPVLERLETTFNQDLNGDGTIGPPVGPTSPFPYDCVVLIESPDPGNPALYNIGSGVVIGPHTILTASHVVYDTEDQIADQNIRLYPGWSGADPRLGPGYVSTAYTDHFYEIASTSGSLTKAQSTQDFAIIDTSYTFTSWMGVVTNWQGGAAHMTGYPMNAGGAQTDQVGTIYADPSYSLLDYGTLSTSPGNSGGPIWLNYNGSDDVAGIVSTSGWASQITTADWNQIVSWVSEDGYSLTASSPSLSAQAVQSTNLAGVVQPNDLPLTAEMAGLQDVTDAPNFTESYADLIKAMGANDHTRTAGFSDYGYADGLASVANYADPMKVFAANTDAAATHSFDYGLFEGCGAGLNAGACGSAHADLIDMGTCNDAFLAALSLPTKPSVLI
jgi:V8-like Glu-specific endopeptidase